LKNGVIFTEDQLIKTVVEYFLKELNNFHNYQVVSLNGFANFGKNFGTYQELNAICIADGDQRKDKISEISLTNLNSKNLLQHFKDITGCSYSHNINGKPEDEKIILLKNSIHAFTNKVKFIDYYDIEAFLLSIKDNSTHKAHEKGKDLFNQHCREAYGGDYSLQEQNGMAKQLLTMAKNSKNPNYENFKTYIVNQVDSLRKASLVSKKL
jgi:hypothetical protein